MARATLCYNWNFTLKPKSCHIFYSKKLFDIHNNKLFKPDFNWNKRSALSKRCSLLLATAASRPSRGGAAWGALYMST